MTGSPRNAGNSLTRRSAMQLAAAGATALAVGYRPRRARADSGPIKIGLSAAFSGPNADAGVSMSRGAQLAIDEINQSGGVLGRKVELVTRDNEHKLDRGVAQARELIEREGCAALIGSQGSFIGLAVIDTMTELTTPWFGTSVGGVKIIENGRDPNYMFRVATNDRYVAQYLVGYALDKLGSKKIGILNEDTGWGVPAIEDLKAALSARGMEPASVDKMKVGDSDFTPQMLRAKDAGVDAIVTFSNSVEMANALRAGNKLDYRPKVVAAWGLANSNFPSLAGDLANGVLVMQTFTFENNKRPKAIEVFKHLVEKYPAVKSETEVVFPSFLGDTFDAVHLMGLGFAKAGSTEGPKVLAALQDLGEYKGLIKDYSRPFTATNHEALSPKDYMMSKWEGTKLMLVA